MSIIDPLLEFRISGWFDLILHPGSYYNLSRAVIEVEEAVKIAIDAEQPLEDITSQLAKKEPRLRELAYTYSNGEQLRANGEELSNSLYKEESHGPTRRLMQGRNLIHERIWKPACDYATTYFQVNPQELRNMIKATN